jgi:hypothetical protein
MSAISYITLAHNLFLVEQRLEDTQPPEAARTPIDHIAIIDCSGSMAYDLPRIREQLKRRLPSLLDEEDTFTLIWFSGRDEFGTLISAERIHNLKDLETVNKCIDRWLKPIGLTGFEQPLKLATKIAAGLHTLAAKIADGLHTPQRQIAVFFMSDGQDNQSSRDKILAAVAELRMHVAAATFVEFGYNADRATLAAMAQAAGGVHVFAADFDAYAPAFERALLNELPSAPRKEVRLAGAPVDGLAFTLRGADILTFQAEKIALVNADASAVYYLTSTPPAGGHQTTRPPPPMDQRWHEYVWQQRPIDAALYATLALFATRMRPDIIYPLLKQIGDGRFTKMFATCFGKQAYTAFMEAARAAAIDPDERLLAGYDPNCVPNEDAFTILHLLELLQSDDSTRVLVDHPAFKYSRISRRRIDADEGLSAEEQGALDDIRVRLAEARDTKTVKALQAEIDAIIANKRAALKFVADPAPDGYEIAGLTFNETQPNVSIKVRRTGTVDLTTRANTAPAAFLADRDRWCVPAFPTHIWRNYAIIAHGLVNIEQLPVKISSMIERKLAGFGVSMMEAEGGVTVIDLRRIPIINQGMVRGVCLADAAQLEFELTRARAFHKVYRDAVQAYPTAKTVGFAEQYGAEGAAWLEEQGITDNGFAPRSISAESTDYITGRALDIKLAGYSTLPKVAAVREKRAKIAAGDHKIRLNGPEALMADALREIVTLTDKRLYLGAAGGASPETINAVIQRALIERQQALVTETRALILRAARMKWPITVGQTWFKDLKTIEDTTLDIYVPHAGNIKATAELREIQIKV